MRPIRVLSDIPVLRNWYKTKTYICKYLYNIRNIKQIIYNKYATNLKTTISPKSLRNSGVLLLLFEFNNFTSGPCNQHSNQWQCNIIVTCLRLYHVTSVLHCHWREFWCCGTDVNLTYIHFGTILTKFYVIFSRQEHQIDVLKVTFNSEILRFQPFHFSFIVALTCRI